MTRWILVGVLLLGACDHRLVKKGDLDEIGRLTKGTHEKIIGDLNQRMTNLENARNRDFALLAELVKQGKDNAPIQREIVKTLERINEAQAGYACHPVPAGRPGVP